MSVVPYCVKAAYEWHHGQMRRYTNLPYFVHPCMVASIIERTIMEDPAWHGWVPNVDLIIGAAYLHDVIEDCGVNEVDFQAEFGCVGGMAIYYLVMEVTQVSKLEDGNRATRKALDNLHYRNASPAGASIKLADIYENALGMRTSDPQFWPVWRDEAIALLPYLTHGHPTLYTLASTITEPSPYPAE